MPSILQNDGTWSKCPICGLQPCVCILPPALVGDGVTDNRATLQDLIDEASAYDGVVLIPAGDYVVRGTLFVPGNVTISGGGKPQ